LLINIIIIIIVITNQSSVLGVD